MRSFIYAIYLSVLALYSCTNTTPKSDYFNLEETGVKSGGVRLIPIETPSGRFNIWTKRVGNNPKIKLLLLHGGPSATHEYFECFDSYLPSEGIEY